MEGPMFEVDLNTFKTTQMFDLTEELAIAPKFENASANATAGAITLNGDLIVLVLDLDNLHDLFDRLSQDKE
jgi:hypothetical protein